MPCFSARERTVQPTSQATDLSEDVLQMLRGAISEGAFGLGLSPLQREAGTAARQYVESGGGPQFQFDPLVENLREQYRRETERGAAQTREGMGRLGLRFSTPLAREEGRFRRESQTDFLTQLGDMFRQSFESRQNRFLQSMQMLQGMGAQNIAPFMQMAGQGVFPTETTFERPPWMQGVDWLLGLGQAGAGFAGGGFGGGRPTGGGGGGGGGGTTRGGF